MAGDVTIQNLRPRTISIAARVSSYTTFTERGVIKNAGGYSCDLPGAITLPANGSETVYLSAIQNDALLSASLQSHIAAGNVRVNFGGAVLSATGIRDLAIYDYEVMTESLASQTADADATVIMGIVQRPGVLVSAKYVSAANLSSHAENPILTVVNYGATSSIGDDAEMASLDLSEEDNDLVGLTPFAFTLSDTAANLEVAADDVIVVTKTVGDGDAGANLIGRFVVVFRVAR